MTEIVKSELDEMGKVEKFPVGADCVRDTSDESPNVLGSHKARGNLT